MSAVRALLDDALVSLTRAQDGSLTLETIEEELETALHFAYRALAVGGSYSEFQQHASAVKTHGQRTLAALQEVPSDDPAINRAMRLVAQAFSSSLNLVIFDDEEVDLPKPGAAEPLALATIDEPRLVNARTEVLRPHLPLPHLAPPAEAPPPDVEGPPITSLEELEAAMAETKAALTRDEGEDDERTAALEVAPTELDDAQEETTLQSELPDLDDAREVATNDATPPELDGAEASALRERFGVVVSIEEQHVEQAQECFLDLSVMGRMRRPEASESWESGERTERRLLRRVDALAALGESIYPELVEMLADQPVPDPEMTWGAIFFFGSIRGDDMIDQATRIARSAAFDDEGFGADLVAAVSDAFTLAPHPRIDGVLGEWLEEPDPRRREVAVRALSRRRALSAEQHARAMDDPDREVRLAAARAVATLEHLPVSRLNALLYSKDEDFARAALWGASQRRTGAGVRAALDYLAQGLPGFAGSSLLLAVAGGEPGRQALGERPAGERSPDLLRALGWLGEAKEVERLLDFLAAGEHEEQAAALDALERITGASLSETSPEGADRPVPPFGDRFVRYEPELDLLQDPEPWRTWWARHKDDVLPNRRYRFGHAYSLRDSLWELEGEDFTNPQREMSYTELVAWSGGTLPLDRQEFIVRQRRQLASWREYLGGRLNTPVLGWKTTLLS